MCSKTSLFMETLQSHQIEFRILRHRPKSGRPPGFQSYQVKVDAGTTVLDALEQIRLTMDDTLMYRHSCHHSACGTCACMINGTQRLACTTRVLELNHKPVVLEPLSGFRCLGDLVVDMTRFYDHLDPDWSQLKTAEPLTAAHRPEVNTPLRLEDCIECGACVSACPVTGVSKHFMGPAALAALNNELGKTPGSQAKALLEMAAGPTGERMCDRALACSRVCPTGVYPARHITDLRKALGNKAIKK